MSPPRLTLVYVAGPFRGPNAWIIAQRIRQAETIALEIWKAGAVAICPHANTAHYQGALPDKVWLEGDLEIVRRCDAMMMVPGWKLSTGARSELSLARELGKPVFMRIAALQRFLAYNKTQKARSQAPCLQYP